MNLAAINGVCKERIIFKTFLVVVKACMSMMKMIMFLIFRAWAASLTEASVRPQKQCLFPQILRYVNMVIVYWEKLEGWDCISKMSLQYKAMHWKSQLLIKCIFFLFPSVLCMCPSKRIQFFFSPTWYEQTFNFNLISE